MKELNNNMNGNKVYYTGDENFKSKMTELCDITEEVISWDVPENRYINVVALSKIPRNHDHNHKYSYDKIFDNIAVMYGCNVIKAMSKNTIYIISYNNADKGDNTNDLKS